MTSVPSGSVKLLYTFVWLEIDPGTGDGCELRLAIVAELVSGGYIWIR
jgi:hypothetical protein